MIAKGCQSFSEIEGLWGLSRLWILDAKDLLEDIWLLWFCCAQKVTSTTKRAGLVSDTPGIYTYRDNQISSTPAPSLRAQWNHTEFY